MKRIGGRRKIFSIGFILFVLVALLPTLVISANTQTWLIWLPIAMNNYPLITPPATPTQPVEPDPTPSPPPAEIVQVLPNHSSYINSFDGPVVVGEVFNNTASNIKYVKVTARYYDSNDTLLDWDWSYVRLDILKAGEKGCFRISLLNEVPGWTYYKIDVAEYTNTLDSRPDITLLSHRSSIDPTFGWYKIIGEVRNDLGLKVRFVKPIFTLYDVNGFVYDCDWTYTTPSDIEPGETALFSNNILWRDDYSDVVEYRIQIDGRH
jgi:hypothetical protein